MIKLYIDLSYETASLLIIFSPAGCLVRIPEIKLMSASLHFTAIAKKQARPIISYPDFVMK